MDIHRPIVTYAAVSAFALHTEEGRASLVSEDVARSPTFRTSRADPPSSFVFAEQEGYDHPF